MHLVLQIAPFCNITNTTVLDVCCNLPVSEVMNVPPTECKVSGMVFPGRCHTVTVGGTCLLAVFHHDLTPQNTPSQIDNSETGVTDYYYLSSYPPMTWTDRQVR